MPTYEYSCKKCEAEFEVIHSIKENPEVLCPNCGSKKTFKMISACGIVIHNTGRTRTTMDTMRKENDQRADLRQNYGIEKITPLRRGATVDDVYKEVKSQGTFVKDKMQYQKMVDDANRKEKQKKWMEGAVRRTPARGKMMAEMRAKEVAQKRTIKI